MALSNETPGPPNMPGDLASHQPLSDIDPDKVGDFWLDARLTATPAGIAYTAHEDGGDAVMLLLLSEGAAEDPAARARFSGEINAMHIDTVVARGGEGQDEGLMDVRYRAPEREPQSEKPRAPWAALAFDGTTRAVAEAHRVLTAVDLTLTPQLNRPSGPDYRLHWFSRSNPGRTRSWPLPWPGRKDRAGWITMLVAFLLMVLITAVALLLAILLFQNQPLVAPPPPIPSQASGGGSGSPQSEGSDGSSSGEPSSSGSEGSSPETSPGDGGGPYSHSPSMNIPEGSESGNADPSTNPRLGWRVSGEPRIERTSG